jgi:hypothetical protein
MSRSEEHLRTSDLVDERAEDDVRHDETGGDGRRVRAEEDARTRLFNDEDSDAYLDRWDSVQATFVDDPRDAVEHADELVAEVIRHLAKMFSQEREDLEHQWASGGDVSTEDLRVALQRYRSFFNRLLEM